MLRPGGRIALAVWDAIEQNPWAQRPARVLVERGLVAPPASGDARAVRAGARRARARAARAAPASREVNVESLELHRRHASFEEFWETTLDLSRAFHDAVLERPPREIEEIRTAVHEQLAEFEAADGTLDIPARTLVASAGA